MDDYNSNAQRMEAIIESEQKRFAAKNIVMVILALVVLAACIFLAYKYGHNDAFDAGYDAGYEVGYSAGRSDGYSEGHTDGFRVGYANGSKRVGGA